MFTPLAFLGLTVLGATSGKKRGKRKQDQSSAEEPKQRDLAERRRRVMEIKAGISFRKKPAESQDRVVPPFVGGRRVVVPRAARTAADGADAVERSDASSDELSISRNGRLGFLGARWWALHGRPMLMQIRQQDQSMLADAALQALLRQALPAVEWDAEELPRGAQMIARRLKRFVEAAYLGTLTDEAVVDVAAVQSIPSDMAAKIEDAEANTPQIEVAATDKPRIEVVPSLHHARRGARGGSKKPDLAAVETENTDEPQGDGGSPDEASTATDASQDSAG